MQFNLENIEIDPDAARQYIDARSAFTELERTQKNALQVRGGMVWKTVDDKEYLIRTSPTGAQKGLGRWFAKPRLSTKVSKRKSRQWTSGSVV